MRTLTIFAFVLFSFMPVTVFALYANGQGCLGSHECTSGYCNTTLPSPVCQALTTTSNSSGTVTSLPGNTGVTLLNPLKGGASLDSFLGGILNFVIRIGTVVVILMLVLVGFKFVTAQGKEAKITEAKTMLLWTIIGALVLLGSKAIQLGITATVQALSTGG